MLIIVGTLTIISLVIELLRNKNNHIRKIFERHFNFMLRKNEIEGLFTGATWLLLGNFLTIYIFPCFCCCAGTPLFINWRCYGCVGR